MFAGLECIKEKLYNSLSVLQTKETLTLRASSFGSKCEISEKLMKKLGNDCGIIELVASFASFKNNKELKKGDGAKRSRIPGEIH